MTFILTLQEVALSPLPVGRVRQQQHQRALSEPGRGRGRRAGKQDKENVETGPESTDTEQDRAPNIKHSDNQQIELNSSGSIMLKFVDSSGLDITKAIKEKTASPEKSCETGNVLLSKDEVNKDSMENVFNPSTQSKSIEEIKADFCIVSDCDESSADELGEACVDTAASPGPAVMPDCPAGPRVVVQPAFPPSIQQFARRLSSAAASPASAPLSSDSGETDSDSPSPVPQVSCIVSTS